MSKKSKKGLKTKGSKTISLNKRARFEYHIDERLEAGLSLEGWEVKSLTGGKSTVSPAWLIAKVSLLSPRPCTGRVAKSK